MSDKPRIQIEFASEFDMRYSTGYVGQLTESHFELAGREMIAVAEVMRAERLANQVSTIDMTKPAEAVPAGTPAAPGGQPAVPAASPPPAAAKKGKPWYTHER